MTTDEVAILLIAWVGLCALGWVVVCCVLFLCCGVSC